MNEALTLIDVPAIRPPGVTKRQWRLAVLLPRCETAYEALIQAGYKPSTARGIPGPISAAIGTQRATEAIAKGRLDSARDIKRKASSKVSAELDEKQVDPSFALSAWATASKIESEYPDADTGVGEAEHAIAQAYIEKVIQFAVETLSRKCDVPITATLSAQDIADIVVKAQTA